MKPWMRWTLWIVLFFGAVFGVLRYFFMEFHTVPNEPSDPRNWSNSPNLEPGDFVLVWRGGQPHVGDMVRCPDPSDPSKWLVARVLGIPGDKIEMPDPTTLRINGFRISTSACGASLRRVMQPDGVEAEIPCANEEIGGSKHDIHSTGYALFAETKVEAGKLFLLSDNRSAPYTYDSRVPEVGQLPMEACTQRLVVRLWSKKGWGDSERRLGFLF